MNTTLRSLRVTSIPFSQTEGDAYHLSYNKYASFSMRLKTYPDKPMERKHDKIAEVGRISLSSDIVAASRAITVDTNKLEIARLKKEDLVLYIYRPVLNPDDEVVTNEELLKNNLIFDAPITKEYWVVTDREYLFELIGSITISTSLKDREIVYFDEYGTSGNEIVAVVSSKNNVNLKISTRRLKHSPVTASYKANTSDAPWKSRYYQKYAILYIYAYEDNTDLIDKGVVDILDKDVRLKVNLKYSSMILKPSTAEYNRLKGDVIFRHMWKVRVIKTSAALTLDVIEILDTGSLVLDKNPAKRKLVKLRGLERVSYSVDSV